MVFANLKNAGALVTILGLRGLFAAPNDVASDISAFERERLEG
jgi:hypothetical protein